MTRWDRTSIGVVAFATLIGLVTRLAAVVGSAFPLNDGGLFYTMIGDLLSNRLALPTFSSYNAISMPFAYPPLGLYAYAILSLVSRISILQLVQYGPPLVSVAAIPAFYLLAKDMLSSKPQAAFAALVFSLLPRAFDWLIMGGGVTRTLGMLFALLTMRQAFLLFASRSNRAIMPLIVLGSLVVYSHPEAATHTAMTAVLFYLWHDRSRRGFAAGLLVAGGIVIATAPWWGLVISRHSIDPFVAAAAAARQDSYNPLVGLFALFRFDFADEPFMTILTGLGLIGIAVQLAQRKYLVPLWLLAMHTIEPRGGTLFMTIPLAMCAGIALDQAILPALGGTFKEASAARSAASPPPGWLETALRGGTARLFVGFVIVYGMMSAYSTAWRIRQVFTLGLSDLQAAQWVRSNVAPDARFAIISGGLPLRDATSEWFPALTGRQSVGTVFGFEWIGGENFSERVRLYQSLQACAKQDPRCLRAWAEGYGLSFDYVYLRESSDSGRVPLGVLLDQSSEYKLAYSSETIRIYRRQGTELGLAVGAASD